METITLTNPETGETWTSGAAGRRKKWVSDQLLASGQVPSTKTLVKELVEQVPGCLRVWKLCGIVDEEVAANPLQKIIPCYIVAKDAAHAIRVANPTFLYPIGNMEFARMWREVETGLLADMHKSGIDVTVPGIWEGGAGKWTRRNIKK
jgi:hypothetical protein